VAERASGGDPSSSDRETSQTGGAPVECFRFSWASQERLLTSGDSNVTLTINGQALAFAVAYCKRGAAEEGAEDDQAAIEVTLERSHEIAQLFALYAPTDPVQVQIFRFHFGENDAIGVFSGAVASAKFEAGHCILSCLPDSAALKRKLPRLTYQAQCPWATYSQPCGLNAEDFKDSVAVESVSGSTLKGAHFADRPTGWYDGGWIQRDSGERRYVTSHVLDTIKLQSPFIGLRPGETVQAFAGDDHLEGTCRTKFNNIAHFMGFSRIPSINPFQTGWS